MVRSISQKAAFVKNSLEIYETGAPEKEAPVIVNLFVHVKQAVMYTIVEAL